MPASVVLLRGINVGGRNRIKMAELRQALEGAGLRRVRTYIQSGNIIADTTGGEEELSHRVEVAIEERWELAVSAIVRNAEEFVSLAREHPFASSDIDSKFLHVAFLDGVPAVAIDEVLSEEELAPDRFKLDGREVYLAYPRGSARSKLTYALLEKRLGLRATARNWNTVIRIASMIEQ